MVHKLTEEERNEVKKAFLASPDFKWTLGGESYQAIDQGHLGDVTSYILECVEVL